MNCHMFKFSRLLALTVVTLAASACATHTVKSTTYSPIIQDSASVPEELLLDIGVAVFDPGIDEISSKDEETTNQDIRVAESRYVSYLLSDTLQRSGNWGIVRVLPNDESPMDLVIDGTILQSDGEAMRLRVKVTDSAGREWYTR